MPTRISELRVTRIRTRSNRVVWASGSRKSELNLKRKMVSGQRQERNASLRWLEQGGKSEDTPQKGEPTQVHDGLGTVKWLMLNLVDWATWLGPGLYILIYEGKGPVYLEGRAVKRLVRPLVPWAEVCMLVRRVCQAESCKLGQGSHSFRMRKNTLS